MGTTTKPKAPRYIVRDARSREDFRFYSAESARAKMRQLFDNGRTALVSPPLPKENPL